jgi:hypothetical protein
MKTTFFFALAMAISFTSTLVFAQDTTLTITSTGRVGIGTINPTDKLDVRGTTRSTTTVDGDEAVVGSNTATTGGGIGVHGRTYSSDGFGVSGFNTSTSTFGLLAGGFWAIEAGSNAIANTHASFVGGTPGNGPWAGAFTGRVLIYQGKLIFGNFGSTGSYAITLPNNADTTGRGIANAWNTYSSRRWKTNIKTLNNALQTVEKLRGVSYDEESSGKHNIGLIAEEVGKVIPEVVTYEPNGKDATSIDYSRLVAVLIEAVKEQQKQIDELKAALNSTTALR